MPGLCRGHIFKEFGEEPEKCRNAGVALSLLVQKLSLSLYLFIIYTYRYVYRYIVNILYIYISTRLLPIIFVKGPYTLAIGTVYGTPLVSSLTV